MRKILFLVEGDKTEVQFIDRLIHCFPTIAAEHYVIGTNLYALYDVLTTRYGDNWDTLGISTFDLFKGIAKRSSTGETILPKTLILTLLLISIYLWILNIKLRNSLLKLFVDYSSISVIQQQQDYFVSATQ